MTRRLCLLAVALVATAPAAAEAKAGEREPPTVWLVGDSITRQYQPTLIARKEKWSVVGLGVGGDTTTRGLCRVRGYLGLAPLDTWQCVYPSPTVVSTPPMEAPDVAVILFSANDIAFHLAFGNDPADPIVADHVVSELKEIVALFQARGTTAVVALPFSPRRRPTLEGYQPEHKRTTVLGYWQMQDGLRALLKQQDFRLVDFMATNTTYFFDRTFDGELWPPHEHASSKGIGFLAHRASRAIGRALKHRRTSAR